MKNKNRFYKDIEKKINGKVIMVTGGTGSFGHEVVDKLTNFEPKKIIIYSRDEKKQFDMRNHYDDGRLEFIIGNVRDAEHVNAAMEDVDLVFHAAALKQVPACEFFPIEAVKTNVLGSNNVITSALKHNIERIVVLSTDKAAYPINAMGETKALMEKIMIAASRKAELHLTKKTVACGVRYGNVMCSRGSVIPYFINLIKQGKPMTATCLEMTRFMLPLRDAVDLVLFALTNGDNGTLFVRKAPACNIKTLIIALAKIFDYKGNSKVIGIRPGEKVHETLITREEFMRAKDVDDYFRIDPESDSLDYDKYFFKGTEFEKMHNEGYTSENTRQMDVEETIELLLSLKEVQASI